MIIFLFSFTGLGQMSLISFGYFSYRHYCSRIPALTTFFKQAVFSQKDQTSSPRDCDYNAKS